jgi:hypothetical protein
MRSALTANLVVLASVRGLAMADTDLLCSGAGARSSTGAPLGVMPTGRAPARSTGSSAHTYRAVHGRGRDAPLATYVANGREPEALLISLRPVKEVRQAQ